MIFAGNTMLYKREVKPIALASARKMDEETANVWYERELLAADKLKVGKMVEMIHTPMNWGNAHGALYTGLVLDINKTRYVSETDI